MKLLAAIAVGGLVVGIGGQLLLDRWYYGLLFAFLAGFGVWIVSWKRPTAIDSQDDPENQPPLEPVNVIEQELRRKDRGEVPRSKN